MAVRLTKRLVESIPPGRKDVIVWDDLIKGFGLKVTPTGRRVYFAYYRAKSGRQRRPSIGKHGTLTVDQAREIAKGWLAQATLGGDVGADRKEAKAQLTVSELGDRYLKDYAERYKKPRSVVSDRANLANHIVPLIGKLLVKDVTRSDLERLQGAIRDGRTARVGKARARGRRIVRGGSGVANRVLALASKMFACAEGWGLREGNPARGIRKFREHRRDRFLDQAEIARLLAILDQAEHQNIDRLAAAAVKILLYTGLRSGEVMGLRWTEVDLNQGSLRLTDSKTGSRTVPVSSYVVDVFKGLPRASPDDLVFAGAKPDTPLALTRPWYRLRAAAKIDQTANLHCLRHTFASWSVMGGLSLPQVGAVLGHKTAQTTLRYADHRQDAIRGYSQKVGDSFALMEQKNGGSAPSTDTDDSSPLVP